VIIASCYFYLVLNKVLFTPNQPFPLFEIDLGLKMIISLEEIRARNDLNRLDFPPSPVCVGFDTRYVSKRTPPYILTSPPYVSVLTPGNSQNGYLPPNMEEGVCFDNYRVTKPTDTGGGVNI